MSLPLLIGDAAQLLGLSEEQARRVIDAAGLGTERDTSGRRVIPADRLVILIAERASRTRDPKNP